MIFHLPIMISGGNRALFTKLNVVISSKYLVHNPTWLKNSNFSESKCLSTNNYTLNINKVVADRNESEEISVDDIKPGEKSFTKPIIFVPEVKIEDPLAESLVAKALENEDDHPDLIMAFQRLNIFLKKKKYRPSLKKRGYSACEKFQNLCMKIGSSLDDFDVDDLILLLFVSKKFKLADNYLCNVEVIKRIYENKKELNLQKLVLVYHILLEHIGNNKDSEDARVLKEKFESSLLMLAKKKLESNSVEEILELLANASKFPLPSKLKIVLLYSALDLGKEKWCEFGVTKNFLTLLNFANRNDPDFPILEKKLIDILMECSNDSRFRDDIMNFITELTNMMNFKKLRYEQELVDTLVDAALENNASFDDKMIIIDQLGIIRHIHRGLMENLLQSMSDNPELVTGNVLVFLSRILVTFDFHAKKNNLESFFKYVDSMDWNGDAQEQNMKYLSLLLNCMILGHLPLQLLRKMSEKINTTEFQSIKLNRWNTVIFANAAISTWYPDYLGQFATEELIGFALKRLREENKDIHKLYRSLKVKKLIESAIGIKNCVLVECLTKHGIPIEQVMVLNEEGKPIKLPSKKNNEDFYIESISIPPGHKLVFILNFFPHLYYKNDYNLVNKFMNKVKILKQLGIVIPAVFTTNPDDKMSYNEKGKFLFQQIKSKYLKKISEPPQISNVEKPITIPHYPFLRTKSFNKIDIVIPSEKQWSEGFLTTLEGQIWYTDGSFLSTGAAGSGVYYPDGEFELSNSLDVDTSMEAEISGLLECAKEAISFVKKNYGKDCKPVVNIVTDALTVVKYVTDEHNVAFGIKKECKEAVQNLSTVANLRLIWAPGHFGIQGNMTADTLAKKGASVL